VPVDTRIITTELRVCLPTLRLLYAWHKRCTLGRYFPVTSHTAKHTQSPHLHTNFSENSLQIATDTIHELWVLDEMYSNSIIDKFFTDGVNEAGNLYNDDRLDECIEKTRNLLADGAIPRYHRMKALILLASTLGDWEEANDCHVEAETSWRVVRRWHPEGEDLELDKHMEHLRKSLDEVRDVLGETEPEDYDFDDIVDDRTTAHEEHVKDATASMGSLDMAALPSMSSDHEMGMDAPAVSPDVARDAPTPGAGDSEAHTHQD
jgi:hypothetical protein